MRKTDDRDGTDSLDRTLRRKLVPFFILSMMLMLLLFSIIEFMYNYREYEVRREQFIGALVESVEDHLSEADSVLSLVADLEITERLREVLDTYGYFTKILVFDGNGQLLASVPHAVDGETVEGFSHEWSGSEAQGFAEESSAEPSVDIESDLSDPRVSPHSGKVNLRMHCVGASGLHVIGELNLGFLQAEIEETMQASLVDGVVFFTDREGNIIAHPDSRQVEKQVSIGGTELFRRLREGEGKRGPPMVQRLFGERYYARSRLIPATGWILVDAVEIPSLLGLIFRSIFFITGLVIILLTALALYMRSLISRLVINPLIYFLHIVERSVWEDVPLSIDDNIATFSEFMVLQNAFNVMTGRIWERDEELRKYLKAIQEAGFGIYITDVEGRIEYINPAFCRMTEYSEEEIKGKTPHMLYSGKQKESYYTDLWGTILNGEVWEEEIVNRKKSGKEYFAHQTIAPIYSSEGKIRHFVAIQTDVTERREAEKRIKESETLYRSIFRDAGESVFLVDPSDGSFIEFNDQTHLTLGYSREEFARLKIRDIEALEDPEEVVAHMRQLMDTGYGSFETEHLSKEGDVRNVIMTVRYLEIGDKDFFLAIAHDITDRKRMEKELRISKERAEEASRIKSDFLANISHEIRTPMNSVLGYAQLLNHHLEDMELLSYVSSIENSGNMLLSLINDILDMSKIEAGRLQLEYGPVRVESLLEEIRRVFDLLAREKGLLFHIELSPEVPEILMLDEVRIRQILLNLVGNAMKFTDQGEVLLRVSLRKEATGEEGDVQLTFEVKDTGIGIPEHQRERIFDAFRQQEGQSNRKYGGTGLGLSISKRLTEAMGGKLDLDSELGRGTSFYVRLPNVGVADKGSGEEPFEEAPVERISESEPYEEESESEELVESLVNDFLPRWENIRSTMFIDEVESFARDVLELSRSHGHTRLEEYAESLMRVAENLNVELLSKLVGRFGEIVEEMRKT